MVHINGLLPVQWGAFGISLYVQSEQAESEVMGAVLPMLAYGNLDQQDWCSLNTKDCIQFIQLAQHGLQFLLRELASIHARLVRLIHCILVFVLACGQCLSKCLSAQM